MVVIQRVVQLVLRGTHQPLFRCTKAQWNMAVTQVRAEGSQNKPQCIDAENIPDLQMLTETPDKNPGNETQCPCAATVINEAFNWMGPKDREWCQGRRRVVDSMIAPQRTPSVHPSVCQKSREVIEGKGCHSKEQGDCNGRNSDLRRIGNRLIQKSRCHDGERELPADERDINADFQGRIDKEQQIILPS